MIIFFFFLNPKVLLFIKKRMTDHNFEDRALQILNLVLISTFTIP